MSPDPKQDDSWLTQYYTPEKTLYVEADQSGTHSDASPHLSLSMKPSDKYDVIGDVGQGGMKSIYEATDRDSSRTIAMATLNDGQTNTNSARRFVREARITAFLEHPNIVPVHDVGVDASGNPFFTMKLLRGESLLSVLKQLDNGEKDYCRKYDLQAMMEIFQHICNAIAFAHSRGVLHLDLKPGNIQISDYGEVLIIDWGLARLGTEDDPEYDELVAALDDIESEYTLDGVIKGSPGYMAPEQARGDNNLKNERTDIYALGAILYSMLTWKRPVDCPTSQGAIQATLEGNIVPPSKRAPERKIPAALEAVAMKALSFDQEDRYQSVDDLSRDIHAYMGGFATSAQDVGIFTLLWLLVERHKVISILSAISLTIIVALGAVSLVKIKASEMEALAALEKYRGEQTEKQKLGMIAAPRIAGKGIEYYKAHEYYKTIEELNLALVLDSSLEEAWLYKGCYHLGAFEFGAAEEAFGHCHKNNRTSKVLAGIAVQYKSLTSNGERALTMQEITEFMDLIAHSAQPVAGKLKTRKSKTLPQQSVLIIAHVISRMSGSKMDLDSRMVLLGAALKSMNPNISQLNMSYTETETGTELKLSNNPQLYNLLPLNGLSLVSLDLSNTAVSDLGCLTGMKLVFLDVSHTNVKTVKSIRGMPLKEFRREGIKLSLKVNRHDFPELEEDELVVPKVKKPPTISKPEKINTRKNST